MDKTYQILIAALQALEVKKIEAEKLNALTELNKSEERFRRFAENAGDLMYRYELIPEPRFTWVSPSATFITGYTPEEHYNDPFLGYKLVHPDDRHLLEKLTSDPSYFKQAIVLRWIKKTGEIIWTEQNNVAIFNEKGEITAIEGIARDITRRKTAEDSSRENRYLLNIAGKLANLGGWSVNLVERKVLWSDQVAAIHGMPPEYSPTFEEGIEFYAPEFIPRITKVFNECVEKGIHYDEEMQIITPTGEKKWVRTIGTAQMDNSGKIVKVVGGFQDISEYKRIQVELQDHRQNLEEMVAQGTAELEEKNRELERINSLFVGREFRIRELKQKIKQLEQHIAELEGK